MARHQYQVTGELGWQSNSGNAILAISNPIGSGKKLTLRRFDIQQLASSTTGTAGTVSAAAPTYLQLSRATVAGGIKVSPTRHDQNAGTWPSTVDVVRRASVASATVFTRVAIAKQMNQASLSWMGKQNAIGRLAGIYGRPRKDTAVEGIVIRAGESIALHASTFNNSVPLRVSARVVRSGSPIRNYSFRYYTNVISEGEAVFGIINNAGSGETITLRDLMVEEVGTYDSPYYQLVPIGAVIEAENAETPGILKMDTNSPSPTAIQVRQDVSILPFGMPENALADSSTGSPKGFNYLKTKDFLGPVYRTLFPEYIANRPGALPDTWGAGQRMSEQFVRKSDITIREGEGVALVSGAETAAGATAAVGCSGWSSFQFSVTIDVEPKISPVLQITGLQNPSEIRIFQAGTTTEVAGQENITSGTFQWTFDPEETPSVDISVLSLGYQNFRIKAFALSLANVSIPVQQQVDRQYQNA